MNAEVVAHLLYGAVRALACASTREQGADRVFIDQFLEDGLVPHDEQARRLSHLFSGCVGCGACETEKLSPRNLLLHGRGLTDLDLARDLLEDLAALDAARLERMQRCCPARIPFSQLAGMYLRIRPHRLTGTRR